MREDLPRLKQQKGIRIYDIIYIMAIAGFCSICYKLFYRMAIEYHGKYISDFKWYINLPTSDNKERYRLLGWLFDIMHRHGLGMHAMLLYLAAVIGGIILLSFLYLKVFTREHSVDRLPLEILTLFVTFMGPIYVPVIHEYYYAMSFQTFAWHSPTEQSMIMLSIPAMLCFIAMYEKSDEKVSAKWWVLTMISGFLSAFAKPSFAIDLITAMIVMFLIDLFIERDTPFFKHLGKLFVMGCSLIPTGIYMLIVARFEMEGEGAMYSGGVVVSIKHVLEYNNLAASILCSLAFPIVAWTVNYKLLSQKRYKTVFWVFIMGVVQWALFIEEGERATHGNFVWGRQAGCFFLFLTSVAIVLNNWKDKENFMSERPLARKIYFASTAVLLVLHVVSQMKFFYTVCMGHLYMI